MADKKIFYDYEKLKSYDALISIVLSERGVGKTYGAIKECIKDFLKNGNQFIYLRRYHSELKTATPNFFDAIINNEEFPEVDFQVKTTKNGATFLINGEIAGWAVPLSTSNILKSTSFPKVRTIVFDEFCVTQGVYRYLSNEITQLLDLIETVGRLRDNVRVWLLGNSTSVTNPYFNYWNLTVPYESEFKVFRDGLIVVNYVKNEAYRAQKRKSRFGRLIAGTKYGDYAIENEWLQDNNTFVRKRPPEAGFYFNLQMEGKKYGVWLDNDGYMYISGSYEPNSVLNFSLTQKDHNETTVLSSRISPFVKNIINHWRDAHLCFESITIKAVFTESLLKYVN